MIRITPTPLWVAVAELLAVALWAKLYAPRPACAVGLETTVAASPTWDQPATPTPKATPTSVGERPPVRVIARVEPDRVTIGDHVSYTIEIEAPAGTKVEVPVVADHIGAFEVVDFSPLPPSSPGGLVRTGHRYTLRTFDVGHYVLPAPTVRYHAEQREGEVTGNEVTIEVASVLPPEDTPGDIRDIKPLMAPPFDPRPLYLGLASLVGLVSLGAGLWWALNRPRTPYTVPPPPPHEVALRALDRLWAQHSQWVGNWAPMYVDLTAIVRQYIEQRFGVRAPEMTTEEFLAAAGADSRLSPNHRALLSTFLQQADLVKFARAQPSATDAENAYRSARRFVLETRPSTHTAEGAQDAV